MSRVLRTLWLFSLAMIGFSVSPAFAAEPAYVTRIGGDQVTVKRGGETIPVRVQMLMTVGEVVTAGKDSFVEIRYLSDGCILRVANGRSLVVAQSSPCAAAEVSPKVKTNVAAIEAAPGENAAAPAEENGTVARVTDKSGPVTRANFGEGLVGIEIDARLKAGDTVFAGQDSSVTLYFPKADCEYVVGAEKYLEISDVAPCRRAAAPPEAGTASADVGLALGAVAILGGGAAAAVLLLTGEDDDDGGGTPATPN